MPRRRTSDALRAVDGLVHAHLQHGAVDARLLANLAVAMVTEYSGSARGTLLLEEDGALAVRLALGPGLEPAPLDASSYDAALVEAARAGRRPALGADRLAAPILLGGEAQGVIYLEAADGSLPEDAAELATGAATRVATLLHSARLVEDAAHRARNVEILEALGACLSAGTLSDEHLEHAVEAALHATRSDEALLGLLDERGAMLDLHLRGPVEELRALAGALAATVAVGDGQAARALLGPPALLEPLVADTLAAPRGMPPRRPLGFLAVRRPEGPVYGEAEVTVFRALTHLLAGALARLAYYRRASEDALTGTGSRLALELAIVEAVEGTRRMGHPLSILLVDVDRFKGINDAYGHLVGDAILRAVAATLRSRLRASDFVARFGGDEFLVLLPETAAPEAAQVAEELRARVAAQRHTDARLEVSLSIGIASFPAHGATPGELLRAADAALYRSKAEGRNRVTVAHSPQG